MSTDHTLFMADGRPAVIVAEANEISRSTFYNRVARGWPPALAATKRPAPDRRKTAKVEKRERVARVLVSDLLEADVQANWRRDAACRGMPPEMFYPDAGGQITVEARDLCERCPVRPECLSAALDGYENDGWWGGMSPSQRRRLRARNRLARSKAANR